MAKSKFEYVKQFESEDKCLPNCWIVVRIDGKSFHRFSDVHHFVKPNDDRALNLMTKAAQCVMEEYKDIVLSYGQSDEYSFVFKKNTSVFNRRGSKIMSNIVSYFSSCYVFYWSRFFNVQPLQYPPSFDSRVVLYPSDKNLRDYLSWRQADCHINNLYNTCFWKLVQDKGFTPAQSQERLKGTMSSDKNELLYQEFNTNYNNLPDVYRKGSILISSKEKAVESKPMNSTYPNTKEPHRGSVSFSNSLDHGTKMNPKIDVLHVDLIGEKFWEEHSNILTSR